MLLDLLFSLTSASFHDSREQKSVIVWRADCFDGCTACGAANLRPVAFSQGRGGWGGGLDPVGIICLKDTKLVLNEFGY